MRIFLVGGALAAVIVSAGVVFSRSVLPLAVLHVTMGLVIGLAIGTTTGQIYILPDGGRCGGRFR